MPIPGLNMMMQTGGGAAASSFGMTYIGTTEDGDGIVTMPASVNSGDLLIVVGGVFDKAGTCSLSTPTGWTLQASRSAIGTYQSGSTRGGNPLYEDKQCRAGIWTKIADGTEGSTNLTFGNGGTEEHVVFQYRPSAGSISAVTFQDEEGATGFGSGTPPTDDVVDTADSGKTTITIGTYIHDDNPALTVTGPTFNYNQANSLGSDQWAFAALQSPAAAVDVNVQYDDRPSSSTEGYAAVHGYLEIE